MSNAARKARKRAHRESGYSAETAYESEPKRPTRKYRTAEQIREARRRDRQVEEQGNRMAQAVAKMTRSRKAVDEVIERSAE